jgi:hypothetical protein
MKKYLIRIVCACIAIIFTFNLQAKAYSKPKGEYYQLSVYHFKTSQQISSTEQYLKDTYLPTLHGMGIKNIGIFTSIDNDTAVDKKLYILVPIKKLEQLADISLQLAKSDLVKKDVSGYSAASYDKPTFERIETVVLKAFEKMPFLQTPQLTSPSIERIYELRSYESATEPLYRQKVKMFNTGGEVALFKRLDFNAVFYAEVLSGSRMPNLMYMTTFNNKVDRDAHWKIFGADAEWKTLSAMPEYQNTVSKNDTRFLRPTSYSDY